MTRIPMFILCTLLLCCGSSLADEKKPADAKPADNDASLDDLLKLNPDKKPDDKTKPAVVPETPAAKLTGDQSIDTLLKAIAEMEQAGQRLRIRQDVGIDTQRLQESVLKRLDQAIATAEKQKQEQKQKKQNQPGSSQQKQETGSPQNQQKPGEQKPGDKPGDKKEDKGQNPGEQSQPAKVDPQNPGGPIEESRIEWGRLPARIRGELDQGLGEKFSPLYKKLTEAYYRRLAEEGKK